MAHQQTTRIPAVASPTEAMENLFRPAALRGRKLEHSTLAVGSAVADAIQVAGGIEGGDRTAPCVRTAGELIDRRLVPTANAVGQTLAGGRAS